MNHPTVFTLLGIVAFGFTILLWIYWGLCLPILHRQLFFRTENTLDAFKLLALSCEISAQFRLYHQIYNFLNEAHEATSQENLISTVRVSKRDQKERSARLKTLLAEMDNAHFEIRDMVGETMNNLVSLYVAQRPFVVCVVLPLQALAYFIRRCRRELNYKEVEFAASSLASVPQCHA